MYVRWEPALIRELGGWGVRELTEEEKQRLALKR